jgi:acylphosphatase
MQNGTIETVELHAIVHGYVQGVGFRYITRDIASRLGVKGNVKNLSDGTVEIYAQGSKEKLNEFLALVKTSRGKVDSIDIRYFPPKQRYDYFAILDR